MRLDPDMDSAVVRVIPVGHAVRHDEPAPDARLEAVLAGRVANVRPRGALDVVDVLRGRATDRSVPLLARREAGESGIDTDGVVPGVAVGDVVAAAILAPGVDVG